MIPLRNVSLLAVLLVVLAPALGQTARPKIAALSPSGMQRGREANVSISGTWIGTTSAVVAQHPGIAFDTIKPSGAPAGARNPEGTTTARVRVSPDVPPGRYAVRAVTAVGASDPAYLVVGQWPETPEVEPNSGSSPQRVSTPTTILGAVGGAEDVDQFEVLARKGETLVVDVAAGSIGSPLVPIVVLRDSAGRDVASAMGLRTPDAVVRYRVPADGTYRFSIRDLSFRGGGEFVYRATVGAIPWVTSVFPPAGSPSTSVAPRWRGANLGEGVTSPISLPSIASDPFTTIWQTFAGGMANARLIALHDVPILVEAEPNSLPDRAQPVTAPVVVAGTIDPAPGRATDEDWYAFRARAGEAFVFSLQCLQLGGTIEATLAVHDEKGTRLAASPVVDGVRDPVLAWTAPSEGRFRVRVADMHRGGGPDETYLLRVAPPTPDVRLEAWPDVPIVPPGGRVPVTVSVERVEGFSGPIALDWPGLPEGIRATGALTIPANVNQTVVVLEADAKASTGWSAGWVGAQGRPDRRAKALSETYSKNNDQVVRVATRQPFPIVSVGTVPDVVVDVEPGEWSVAPGGTLEVVVRVARAPGFGAKVPVVLIGAPAGVAGGGEIPAGANEARFTIKLDGNAAVGEYTIAVVGRSMLDELRWMEHSSRAVTLRIRR